MKNDFIKNKNTYNQPKKAIKKTFSFYALVFALLFMFIGSTLGTIAFFRSFDNVRNNVAYADSISVDYQYIGSNIYMPSSNYAVNLNDNSYYIDFEHDYFSFATISIQFTLLHGTANIENSSSLSSIPIFRVGDNLSVGNAGTDGLALYFVDTNNKLIRMSNLHDFYYRTVDEYSYFGTYALCGYNNNASQPTDGFYFSVNMDKGFSCNVQRFRLNTITDGFGSDSYGNYVLSRNVLTYYDEANRECRFTFDANTYVYHNAHNPNGFGFFDRTYYLTSNSNGGGYSQVYIDELIANYNRQIADIEADYESRLNNAVASARQQGYNEGLSNHNTSFLSLFGALFDAPIQALSGLLNFDVLGFNLWNFFTAVITIGIVIFVIRMFL